MFTGCIYQVHTWNVQIHVSMYKEYKSKKLLWSGFEPRTSILSRCLNHYAGSVIVIVPIVTVYICCCTWRLVTYVQRPTRGPAASRASHCRVTGIPGQRPRAVRPSQLTRQSLTPAWQCHGLTVGPPTGPSTGSAASCPALPAWEPHGPRPWKVLNMH